MSNESTQPRKPSGAPLSEGGQYSPATRGDNGTTLDGVIQPFDLDLWVGGADDDDDDCVLGEVTALRAQIIDRRLVSESPTHVHLPKWVPGDDIDDDDRVAEEIVALREQLAEHDAAAEPVTAAEIAWAERVTGTVDADSAPNYYPTMSRIFAQARRVQPERPALTGNYLHVAQIGQEAGFHPTEGVMPAVLNAILDRGDNDVSWAVGKLTADDLTALYDNQVGPLLDRLEKHVGRLADQRAGIPLDCPYDPAGAT